MTTSRGTITPPAARLGAMDAQLFAPPTAAAPRVTARRLVPVSCCLCGSDDAEPAAIGEDFRQGDANELYLALVCRECGLVYLSPRPAEPDGDAGVTPALPSTSLRTNDLGPRSSAAVRALFDTHLAFDATLLCIGRDAAAKLTALDRPPRPAWDPGTLDDDDANGATRLADDLPREHFDLVLVQNVLERQASPGAFVQTVSSLVRPGGRIAIVTPNTHSTSFRLFGGRHWAGYDFPRHVALFGPRQIQRLAQESRLEVTSIATVAGAELWVRSARQFLADWGAPEWVRRRVDARARVARAALGAVEALAQRTGRGAWMIAVLRRPQ